ncbi:MAG: lipoprotein NlpI [Syntrophus sp. PtaB.Bin001]|nr:MAG: lipoprotein NlpI [Syntrophus sp. PtaB.Bin001]
MSRNLFFLIYQKWIFVFFSGICVISLSIHGWAVEQKSSTIYIAHVASFKNSANAESLVKTLEKKGYKAWISKTNLKGMGEFDRIYVGTFESRESANKALMKLKNERIISYFAIELKRNDVQDKSRSLSEVASTSPKAETSKSEQSAVNKSMPTQPENRNIKDHTNVNPLMAAPEKEKTRKTHILEDKSSAKEKVEGNQKSQTATDTEAFSAGKDSSFYYNKGIGYLIKEQYDQALQCFSNSIRIDPKFAEAYIKRGDTWYLKGDNDMAINDYNAAITLKPDYSESYLGRGLAYRNLGQIKKSEENLQKACELKNEESCALLKAWAIILKPPKTGKSSVK